MSRKPIQGQVAIVTGASRGIGAATARSLSSQGCRLVLTARDEEWLEMTAHDVRSHGGEAVAVVADITDLEMVEEVVESALGEFDGVDIVVNAAGTPWPLELTADADAEEWAYSIHSNLVGPFYLVNNVLPVMLDQGYGRIVNLTCRSNRAVTKGEGALRAAKAGLETWTRVVAAELTGTGVQIACLDPGIVDTAARREILEIDSEETAVDISAWLPEGGSASLVTPEEVARMVIWLITTAAEGSGGNVYSGSDVEWRARVQHDLGVGA